MKFSPLKSSAFILVITAALFAGCKKEAPSTPSPTSACTLNASADQSGNKRVFTEDANGRITKLTLLNASGKEYGQTIFTYDKSGKLIKTSFFKNGQESDRTEYYYNGDKLSRLNMYYNHNGTMEVGFNSTFTVDADGHITSMMMFMGNSTTDAEHEMFYDHDSRGNIIKVTMYGYHGTHRMLHGTTEYIYDDKPNPLGTLKYPVITEPATFVNNVLTQTDRNEAGNITGTITNIYEYNSDNLPVKQTHTNSISQTTDVISYSYNCK